MLPNYSAKFGEQDHAITASKRVGETQITSVREIEVRMKTLSVVPTRSHPFIHDLSPRHVQQLLADAVVKEFEPGEIIFREGEPASRLYLIEFGEVELESPSAGCGSLPLEILHAGDPLGWSWLFQPFVWHSQARATRATRVICCNGSRLLVEAEEDHNFGYELMKRVSQIVIHRLQATRRQFTETQAALNSASAVTHC
jgi:CRP-like cAMP-binding protein